MNVLKDVKNPLLKRREIEVSIESDGNPGLEKCKKDLAEKFKSDEKLVVIDRLQSKFGSHEFKVEGKVYDSEESLQDLKINKKKKKEAKK